MGGQTNGGEKERDHQQKLKNGSQFIKFTERGRDQFY